MNKQRWQLTTLNSSSNRRWTIRPPIIATQSQRLIPALQTTRNPLNTPIYGSICYLFTGFVILFLYSFSKNRSRILQEVQNSTKKSPPPKSIILLGDNESGRSTLVSRLKGVESVSKGIGLEYHYIDIKDEDRDGKSVIFSLK